jgi:Undecaprenyl-phosphate glucose phosphotransferase
LDTSVKAILPKPFDASPRSNVHLSHTIVIGLVACLDAAIILVTGFGLFELYLDSAPDYLSRYLGVITIYTILTLQTFNTAGLYRFNAIIRPRKHARKIPVICSAVFLAIVAIGFALKISADFSRIWSFAWFVSSTSFLWLSRFAVQRFLRKAAAAGALTRNIIIYGGGDHGRKLIEHLERIREPWNHIVGVFDDRSDRVGDTVAGYPVLGNLNDMLDYGRLNRSDEILIALPWNSQQRVLQIVRILTALPANIRLSSEIAGHELLHQSVSYKFGVPMLNIMEKPVSGWGALSKNILDVMLGVLFTLIALPIMALAAIAIKLESKGPILFKQQRYGFNNQLIEVYKFRSMYTEMTDANAEQLTTRDDPRVTRVGAFLRRTSLDELPQLLNVLKGEMSVVGPRPHATRAKAAGKLYEDVVDGYAIRHKVKPGITGWAQVNGWRGNTDTEGDIMGRLEHDFYYIENWSVMFDLYIILRTIKAVIVGDKNAY